jgi:CHASE3 domain sensor protein
MTNVNDLLDQARNQLMDAYTTLSMIPNENDHEMRRAHLNEARSAALRASATITMALYREERP